MGGPSPCPFNCLGVCNGPQRHRPRKVLGRLLFVSFHLHHHCACSSFSCCELVVACFHCSSGGCSPCGPSLAINSTDSGEKGSPGNPDTVPTSRDDKPALLHQPKDPQRPRASVCLHGCQLCAEILSGHIFVSSILLSQPRCSAKTQKIFQAVSLSCSCARRFGQKHEEQ